ncbi:MAG: hypothetical protein PSU94_07060 [Lacunisphaera sp.]|nr:hypothetical protein [Lacunisphaera sp.]
MNQGMHRRWFIRVMLGWTFFGLVQFLAGCTHVPAAKPFLVFDALLYRGKPDLSGFGLLPLKPVARFWAPGQSMDEVDEGGTLSEVAKLKEYSGMIFIDIEHWPVLGAPDKVAAQNIAKLARVADIIRSADPKRKFGYYGVLPERIYWPIVQHDEAVLRNWRKANQLTRKIAEHVDVIFPSLYTFYNDPKGWELYARAMLHEARQYGKPVYAFLWPEFETSDAVLRDTAMPAKFWRKQLEVCRELADGVVLWGGWQRDWDANAVWWEGTQDFLKSL